MRRGPYGPSSPSSSPMMPARTRSNRADVGAAWSALTAAPLVVVIGCHLHLHCRAAPGQRRGILVTTSWAGQASHEFVARHGRIEIIDGRKLKYLLMEHLGKDVRIGLPNIPKTGIA